MSTTVETDPMLQTGGEAPAVILPDTRAIFARRAERFAQLAKDHALGDYLGFMGALAQAQQHALDALPPLPLPDAAALQQALTHAMPPIPAQSWPRHAAWQKALEQILQELAPKAPAAAATSMATLAASDPAQREHLAERVLRTELYGEHADWLPFVAAALQVYWTRLAQGLSGVALQALDVAGVCPCCGGLPAVSVIGASSELPGRRYLHCSLCNTEWHVTRAQCTACDAGESAVAYQHLEGDAGLVQAETCEVCKVYLKVVRRDKEATLDPVADDLATIALDLKVDEAGFARGGPNLLLVPGAG